MPKVSVVIAVYNVEKYIERCVRSLFEQTLDSMEYVFVDDCSPDRSMEIMLRVLEDYPSRKSQIKLIRHEKNLGVGAARNHGVAACTGDYIIHCDPDDWVDLNLYELMYKTASETGADLVYCSVKSYESGREPFLLQQKSFDAPYDYLLSILKCESHSGPINKLAVRKIAQHPDLNVPDRICMHEDTLRMIQMIYHCKKVVLVPDVFYNYQSNPASVSHSRWRREHMAGILEVVEILENVLLPKEYFRSGLNRFKLEILHLALYHPEIMTKKEFHKLKKEFHLWQILSDSPCSARMKVMMYASCFSYTLAEVLVRFRMFFISLKSG